MLRKIIHTQQNGVLVLDLPKNLQGRRIEVIAFAIEEEAAADDSKAVTMADFFGTLSPENAESFAGRSTEGHRETRTG